MATLTDNVRRYRLNVPKDDTSVQAWLDAQINTSVSLRTLIREDIARNGCTDITCREVVQRGKVGRPTNAELEQRAQQEIQSLEARKPVERETGYVEPKPVQEPVPQEVPAVPVRSEPQSSAVDDLLGLL